MCHISLSIHPSMNTGSFYVLSIVKNAAMNKGLHTSFIPLDKYSEVDHMVVPFELLEESLH